MINRYLQSVIHWIQKTIGPWVNMILEDYPYVPFLLIIFVWLIAALIMMRKKKPKAEQKKKPKKNPTPAGAYTNFKGEVWYPDGRKWNQDSQKWESPDYKEEPTEQN